MASRMSPTTGVYSRSFISANSSSSLCHANIVKTSLRAAPDQASRPGTRSLLYRNGVALAFQLGHRFLERILRVGRELQLVGAAFPITALAVIIQRIKMQDQFAVLKLQFLRIREAAAFPFGIDVPAAA